MCGIFGVVDLDRAARKHPWNDAELAAIDTARDAMAHRGPDGAGSWHAPGIALSHRRLAILDLSPTGKQPMQARAGSGSVLTFNGEVYNYLELRETLKGLGCTFASTSDTEVLLAALDTWGLAPTLARIRGMYAFAWWDGRALHLARDPAGKKPLYWWQHGQRLVFSSTLQALVGWLRTQAVALTVDPVAVEHHLAGGYIEAPRTIYREIAKLVAGSALTLSPAGMQSHAPTAIPFARHGLVADAANLANLDGLLQAAVQRRLRSDVPVATFLSGGLDSSLVTAIAAKAHPGITAYTVRTTSRNQDEFAIACRVAARTGVRHEVLEVQAGALAVLPELVRHYGEPFGDSSALPTWLIAQQAGLAHRVVLTGDGGDEVQGGYSGAKLFALRHMLHDRLGLPTLPERTARSLDAVVARLPRRVADLDFKALRLLAAESTALSVQRDGLHRLQHCFAADLQPALSQGGWSATVRRFAEAQQAFDETDRALAVDFRLYLPDDLCVKVDVAAMAFAVETRAPLLDLDFTNACWQIRAMDRVRPWQSKRLIRALVARHLPADCVLGRKQGFSIPVDQWLQAPEVLEDLRDGYRRGLPGMPWLQGSALLQTLADRAARGQANGVLLWRLKWLQEWARQSVA